MEGEVVETRDYQPLVDAARAYLWFCRHSVDAGPLIDGNPRKEVQLLAALRDAVEAVDPRPDIDPEISALRRQAWETRRAKYGARGHRGSYLRDRP